MEASFRQSLMRHFRYYRWGYILLTVFSLHAAFATLVGYRGADGAGERAEPYLITASSVMNPQFGPEGITNGSTIWHSARPATYPVDIDLFYVHPVPFSHLRIQSQDKHPDRAPASFRLLGRNGAGGWEELLKVVDEPSKVSNEWREWRFSSQAAYGVVRLEILESSGEDFVTIQHLQLY